MLAPDEGAIYEIGASPALGSPAQGLALIMAARSQVAFAHVRRAAPKRSRSPPASRRDPAAAWSTRNT